MLTLNKGEHKEIVLVNEPEVDLHIVQSDHSSLKVVLINLPGSSEPITNTIHVDHAGSSCHTEIYALACIKNKEQVCTHTRVHHDVGGGDSKQMVKFILADHAQGTFWGEMKIKPHAQQVQAFQTNRNLLLSQSALMRTRPQLEIYADDVKASHGASTGQLDESALFYMQQRGIDIPLARRMLVVAFMKDIIEEISDETLRENLLQTIDGVI